MTQIEMDALRLFTACAKKYLSKEIDWEQRRYEIACDLLANNSLTPEEAVFAANKLIAALKN